MKRKLILSLLLMAALLLSACGETAGQSPAPTEEPPAEQPQEEAPAVQTAVPETPAAEKEELSVLKVEDLPEDFIMGMDVSSLIAEERSGVRFYDFDGQEKDLLQILAENGVTHIRVRVWNDPYDAQGRGYGGGNCDIENALQIGQRAAQFGLKLIVDFHYSDFWADPGKQMVPKAWDGMDIDAKTAALYDYTRESLQLLRDAGVDVAMVQVGNETNNGMAGETDWDKIVPLMAAGSRAVREVYPEALVAVHFTEPQNKGGYRYFADILSEGGLDYDVFASSYYPFWHGSRENLIAVLTEINRDYGKYVMVMETSWPYTPEDSDFSGNSVNADSGGIRDYPFSVQGQTDEVRDVIAAVAKVPGGIGVCSPCPAAPGRPTAPSGSSTAPAGPAASRRSTIPTTPASGTAAAPGITRPSLTPRGIRWILCRSSAWCGRASEIRTGPTRWPRRSLRPRRRIRV